MTDDRVESTILQRLPDKMWWIETLQRLKGSFREDLHADHAYGMNRKHFFVFIRSYLKNRLMQLGFDKLKFSPSQPLHCARKSTRIVAPVIYGACMIIYYVSVRQVCISPSQLVMTCRPV